jgi:uncharacterized membrane protein
MIRPAARVDSRSRVVVPAVWLIGLGVVFIVHDQANLTWGEAWPLFVILVGVASLVSGALGYRWLPAGAWSLLWPLAWIAVGVVLLLSTTGTIAIAPADLAAWWPVALIAVGAWFLVAAVWPPSRPPNETLSVPLGGVTAADVRIRFGGGDLVLRPAPPGILLAGTFDGGAKYRSQGPGSVELEPYAGGWPFGWDHALHWDVAVTGEVPLDLRLDTGANRSVIDLGGLRVRRVELHTGMSETRVLLPAAGGVTSMRMEAGMASVTIEVPAAVAARIRSRVAVGSMSVDERRFGRTAYGFESPGFDMAPNRVDIEIQGGLGSIRIV